MLLRRRAPRRTEYTRKRQENACKKSFTNLCLWVLLVPFFRSRQPNRKKVTKMTSQSPSGTLPGTRQEGKIGLRFALGAFQGRFWTTKWAPNGAQNRSKIDLGAQGPPKSAQEPPGGPKRRPRRPEFEALRGPKAYENAVRKYWSKGLSKPLYARTTNDPWLSGRYWGRSPTGDISINFHLR